MHVQGTATAQDGGVMTRRLHPHGWVTASASRVSPVHELCYAMPQREGPQHTMQSLDLPFPVFTALVGFSFGWEMTSVTSSGAFCKMSTAAW